MSSDPKPPLTTTTSLWPAAAILIVAVATLATFMLIDLVTGQKVVQKSATSEPLVVGGLTRDVRPGPGLTYCLQSAEVPGNIADAFQFPVGTTPDHGEKTVDLGAGDFDCHEPLTTSHASPSSLVNFFNAQLEARGWNLFSKGASNGDPQSLFQKAGNDGFYWIVGVTVTKSTPSSVRWTFTIYQNSETI
ncbi:MAG: hypothetical protein ACYCPT_04145 [Acidimicrobiales bacterium]